MRRLLPILVACHFVGQLCARPAFESLPVRLPKALYRTVLVKAENIERSHPALAVVLPPPTIPAA